MNMPKTAAYPRHAGLCCRVPCVKITALERQGGFGRMAVEEDFSEVMNETKDPRYNTGNPVCDALRFLCDASFAVLPRDAAHKLGEVEKNIWGSVRWFADKSAGWVDESLAAADRLREEWNCRRAETTDTPPATPPPTAGETVGGI